MGRRPINNSVTQPRGISRESQAPTLTLPHLKLYTPGLFSERQRSWPREAHLSTEQDRPQAPPRFPASHVDQEWPADTFPPPRARPQETVGLRQSPSKARLDRLKTRAEYLRAQKGQRQSARGLGIEVCASPDGTGESAPGIRVGITASRKVGGAVERNRAKRRLRAVAASVLPLSARAGHDYVLIARKETLSRPFAKLTDDLHRAVAAAHEAMDRKTARPQDNGEAPRD